MSNLYATLTQIKAELGVTRTTWDALLLDYLERASRAADAYCDRHFYVETATRYFDTGPDGTVLGLDDVLVVTSFACDDDLDHTYGESWTEGDDFTLEPHNTWPKTRVRITPDGDYSFALSRKRYVKVVGSWGYGDGESSSPWLALGVTVTAATAAATSVTVSAASVVEAGMTLLVESEQLYVSAVNDTTLTVERGVNGTTAAAHTTKAASRALYPLGIERTVICWAGEMFNQRESAGICNEGVGDYRVTWANEERITWRDRRLLGPYCRF